MRLTPGWLLLLVIAALSGRGAENGAADPAAATLKLIHEQPVVVDWPVFSGATLPKIDFLNPELVTAACGPYAIGIRYFDAA